MSLLQTTPYIWLYANFLVTVHLRPSSKSGHFQKHLFRVVIEKRCSENSKNPFKNPRNLRTSFCLVGVWDKKLNLLKIYSIPGNSCLLPKCSLTYIERNPKECIYSTFKELPTIHIEFTPKNTFLKTFCLGHLICQEKHF